MRCQPRLSSDPVAFVRERLEHAGCATGRSDLYWCPCHDGHAPALRLIPATGRADDGLAVLVCAAGCAPADILRALDLRVMRSGDSDVPHLYVVLPLAVDTTA
jgi:hypothetical protein